VLALLGIAVFVVAVIAFFAVLFTGRWPDAEDHGSLYRVDH
jgi:hypothetical protein